MPKHKGQKTGGSSDKHLAPQGPYTGDGKVTREIYDKPAVVFRTPDGKRVRNN